MEVGVLGVNHKTADLSLREEIARSAADLSNRPFFPYPIVLLSTCNRTEIYFSSNDLAEGQRYLLNIFRKQAGQAFYSFFGIDCFYHLCKVAAGLDSAIFAESEIQRQVRLAYANARGLPSCMHYLFQKSLKISKEVRSKQQKSSPTLYGALWRLAEWKNKRVLAVGNSEINRGLISFLMHKGVSDLTLCTRNPNEVRIEGIHLATRQILDEWQKFDILVCAAEADGYLIRGKGEKRHTIFDLSVPRNVDPNVGAKVFNIEQIDSWIERQRLPEVFDESIIWHHVIRLIRIYRVKSERRMEGKLKITF